MNNFIKNLFFVLLLMLFLFSCSTTRLIRLSNHGTISSTNQILSISKMSINSPKKGQQVFTFADITSFAYMGYGSLTDAIIDKKEGTVGMRKKLISVDSLHRADFKYFLESDSESLFRDALTKVLTIDYASPFWAEIETDFKYFLPKRGHIHNEVGIYMWLELSIAKDSANVFEKKYEAMDSEEYSTAWVTFPRNSTMNSLFNKALGKILEQILSDNEFSEIQITN